MTRVAWPSLRLGASLVLAYRLEVVVMVLSASVVALLNWSLWTAIFDGRTAIAGRTAPELTTYVVVAFIVTTFYGTRIDEELARRFREGVIAVDLVRPWSLQAHYYFRDLGRAMVSLGLATLPLLAIALLVLPLRLPSLSLVPLFLASLVLAHAIAFGIAWHVGLLSFRLRNATGLTHIKATLSSLLSGAVIPLDIYPDAVRIIALCLPFQGMSHTPANLFVGGFGGSGLVQALLVQLLWAVVLALSGRVFFRSSVRHLVVQGG